MTSVKSLDGDVNYTNNEDHNVIILSDLSSDCCHVMVLSNPRLVPRALGSTDSCQHNKTSMNKKSTCAFLFPYITKGKGSPVLERVLGLTLAI